LECGKKETHGQHLGTEIQYPEDREYGLEVSILKLGIWKGGFLSGFEEPWQ
jgi:hypothetical protein